MYYAKNGSPTLPDGVVTSVDGEEMAASVDATVAEMYGKNITQLSQELGELDERVTAIEENGAGGGGSANVSVDGETIVSRDGVLTAVNLDTSSIVQDVVINGSRTTEADEPVCLGSVKYIKGHSEVVDGKIVNNCFKGIRSTFTDADGNEVVSTAEYPMVEALFPMGLKAASERVFDELTETQKIERTKMVDLGDFNYTKQTFAGGLVGWYVYFNDVVKKLNNDIQNLIVEGYETKKWVEVNGAKVYSNLTCINNNARLVIINQELADKQPADVKEYLKGVHAIYELTTPIEASLEESPFKDKEFRCANGGNEEATSFTNDAITFEGTLSYKKNYIEKEVALFSKYPSVDNFEEAFADKVIDVSDEKHFHEELLEGKKVIEMHNDLGWEARYAKGKNLVSAKPKYIGANPGVTIEVDDCGRTHVFGTLATTNAEICIQDETWNLAYWSKYAGKRAVLCARGITESTRCFFTLNEGTSDAKPSVWTNNGAYVQSDEFIIPSNIKYCRISCKVYGNIGDYVDVTLWAGIFIVEDGLPITCDDKFVLNDINSIDTLYYNSKVSTYANTKEYIDKNAVGGIYVMPEKFGAKGDGVTDDSEAIAKAIAYAVEKSLPVKMYKTYAISQPIYIGCDGIDFEINNIVSNAPEAIVVNGNGNTVKVNSISTSNTAIVIRANVKTIVYNTIDVSTINAKYGIVLDVTKGVLCYQNSVTFKHINGLGLNTGSIGITDVPNGVQGYTSENTFVGGHIGRADIGYRGTCNNTKFYNFHFENVGLGFNIVGNANGLAVGTRYSELTSTKNLIKFEGSTNDNIEHSDSGDASGLVIISPSAIPANRIDLSENYEFMEYTSGVKYSISDRCVSRILAPIACSYPNDASDFYSCISNGGYIWGRKLICEATTKARKKITTSIYDMRDNNKLGILPTTFDIDTNCTIYLHDSYVHFGISEFKVIQHEGKEARIYNSDGKLIWNGTGKGAGIYNFEICRSSDDGYDVEENSARYDGHGICWYVNGEFQTNGVIGEFVVE